MSDHTNVMEAIAGIVRLSTDLMPLNAIWLDFSLRMKSKHSRRITMGDEVRVRMDYLAGPCLTDCTDILGPTHEILECRGNLYNTLFEVDLKDLETGDLLTIQL